MGFSGKPSKGCLPCRERRTKCDLVVPACTQCVRKNRICTGYRNEQDLLFKNETRRVVSRAKRKAEQEAVQPYAQKNTLTQAISASIQQPSRKAVLHDEAVSCFFAHYNERFFSDTGLLTQGFDYMTPVFQADSARGGPAEDVVTACGLAALGNMKGSPELLAAARARQVKVLNKLNQQLQDPKMALSDSSALTCLLLSTFENIMSDSARSLIAQTHHLRGAAAIAQMRGRSNFATEVGQGIYAKMRGCLIVSCIRTREPLPEFILNSMEDGDIAQRDFHPIFIELLARICRLRADYKILGFVDDRMAKEVQLLMSDVEAWDPGERPRAESAALSTNSDETYRVAWQASFWVFQQSARVLVSDLFVEWVRGHHNANPTVLTAAALEKAIEDQLRLCEGLKDSICYYCDNLGSSKAGTRVVGAYSLLYPLSILASLSTTAPETFVWIAEQAEKIAEVFGLRLGKMMAELMWVGIRAGPGRTAALHLARVSPQV